MATATAHLRQAAVALEWMPLEPTVVGNKYYKKGLGLVAERDTKGSTEFTLLVKVIKP